MTFQVSPRWGDDEAEPTVERMREVLAELDAEDFEHPFVSLTHESEWCLSAYPFGCWCGNTWKTAFRDT